MRVKYVGALVKAAPACIVKATSNHMMVSKVQDLGSIVKIHTS